MATVTIRQLSKILENTPPEQAVMIEGIHGIGKSQIVSSHFKKEGYQTITFFLGQLADVGDLTGLPDREMVEVEVWDADSNSTRKEKVKVTSFCPPKWWPFNKEAKVLIFLDEFNRGRDEVYNCIMDMVLNRKFNGWDLPPNTRIIAAQNPSDNKGHYRTMDLDPAMVDRFNKYELIPTSEEWIFWAAKAKVNKNVIGFISKQPHYLDAPIDSDNYKVNEVYWSRRSWERVSQTLNSNPNIVKDKELFSLHISGIVGASAAVAFIQYMDNLKKTHDASKIMNFWNKETKKEVDEMTLHDYIYLNILIADYIHEKDRDGLLLIDNKPTSQSIMWGNNLAGYLDRIDTEAAAWFYNGMAEAHGDGKKWPEKMTDINPTIGKKFFDVIHGKDEYTDGYPEGDVEGEEQEEEF